MDMTWLLTSILTGKTRVSSGGLVEPSVLIKRGAFLTNLLVSRRRKVIDTVISASEPVHLTDQLP